MRDRHSPKHPPLAPVYLEPHRCDHDAEFAWSACRVRPAPPPDAVCTRGAPLPERARYLEFDENGWLMMVLWAAGPEHIVRCLENRPPPPMRVTHRLPGGTVRRWELERTRHDQAGIDRDIDIYLGEAGAPAQPSGYRWFLELPEGCSGEDELWAALHSALGPHRLQQGAPSEDLRALRRAFAALYAAPGPRE